MTTAPAMSARSNPDSATGPAPIVRMVNVAKRFGRHVVLDGLFLDVPEGRTTVILGPSGSGKSVILKHIVGLLKPDAGEIWFRDRRIDGLSERELREVRRQMGFLFQQSALFDSMTVRQNLDFPLIEHSGLSRAERRARVSESLALVDLHDVESKFPSQLSGGQQKRAALARAVILRPALMLYDEPTTGLDPMRSAGISALINKLRNELGISAIVVTHDLACARLVSDQVVMLGEGRIIYRGTMREIAHAEDPRVRGFVEGAIAPEQNSGSE